MCACFFFQSVLRVKLLFLLLHISHAPGFSLDRVSPVSNNIDPLRRWLMSASWVPSGGAGAGVGAGVEAGAGLGAGAGVGHQLWRRVPVIIKVTSLCTPIWITSDRDPMHIHRSRSHTRAPDMQNVAGLVPGAYP